MPGFARRPSRSITLLIWAAAVVSLLLWLIRLLSSAHVLFPSGVAFADITVYQGRFTVLHTTRFFTSRAFSGFAYPAGAAPVYAAFYATGSPTLVYLALAAIAVAAGLFGLARALRVRNATPLFLPLTIALSYPVIFLIQRANIELLLIVATGAAILLYRRGFAIAAAVLIGLAAAVKLYPVFLTGLFLRRRKDLPAFAIGVTTFVLASAAAMAWTGPTFRIAANGFLTGVGRFQDHYVNTVSRAEFLWDHTLFAPVKNWAYAQHTSTTPYIHAYYAVAGLLAVVLFLRVRTLPFLNRAVFLTAAMVSLPPVSFDYTLGHLLVPFVLLLCALLEGRSRATAWFAFACILFVCLPLAGLNALAAVPSGLLQSLALLTILVVSALQHWPCEACEGV